MQKTTAVVESFPILQPDVLFQRLPTYYKIQPVDEKSTSGTGMMVKRALT